MWTMFLIFFGMLFGVFCGCFYRSGQSVWGEGVWLWWGVTCFLRFFKSANVEIVCVVDYFSCYYCCYWWSFGIEYSLQCPCLRRTRTLSSKRLFAIPRLECIFWRGTIISVANVRCSRKIVAMVCKQTWCFVQRVYLHIHLLLLIIHLQIGGFSLFVFEYLLYFLHGMTEVQAWRAPKSRGETHLRVSQSQVAEIVT